MKILRHFFILLLFGCATCHNAVAGLIELDGSKSESYTTVRFLLNGQEEVSVSFDIDSTFIDLANAVEPRLEVEMLLGNSLISSRLISSLSLRNSTLFNVPTSSSGSSVSSPASYLGGLFELSFLFNLKDLTLSFLANDIEISKRQIDRGKFEANYDLLDPLAGIALNFKSKAFRGDQLNVSIDNLSFEARASDPVTTVPEPSTLLILSFGIIMLVISLRRRSISYKQKLSLT